MMVSRSLRPASMKLSVEKWWPYSAPLSAPQKEASSVKMFGMLSSLYMLILAVDSLYFDIENLLCSKEKKSQSLDMIYGNTRVA